MVRHPATTTIHHLCRLAPIRRQSFNVVEQRLMADREVASLGWPIVHLEVDVDGVFAAPRWPHAVIPEAL